MKSKGITIWEQYLERFILGAAVLFFVAFTALQFLSQPNTVEGRGAVGKVTPEEVDDLLREKADAVAARLRPEADAPVTIPDHDPLLDDFLRRLEAPISPVERIAVSEPRFVSDEGVAPPPEVDVTYRVPDVPAPEKVVAEQGFDALEETVVTRVPALQEDDRFAALPYDVTWMTVAALFPLDDLRAELQKPGTEEKAAIPRGWYRGDEPDILDVVLEREELVDGQWTNRVRLHPLPNPPPPQAPYQFTFRSLLEEDVDKGTRDRIFTALGQPGAQRAVIQPEFYPLVNASWVPPNPRRTVDETPVEELTDTERRKRNLQKQINRLTDQRDRAMQRLQEKGGSMQDPPSGPPVGGGSSGGGGGGRKAPPGSGGGMGAGGGGGQRRGGSGDFEQEQRRQELDRLRNRITNLGKQIDRYRERLADLTGEEQVVEDEDAAAEGVDLLGGEDVVVWAHDFTIEPGKTYRYRLKVDVFNPFFARTLDLMPEQQDLAHDLTLSSQASEWTEAKAIPPLKVFVTRATGPEVDRRTGDLGLGQTTIEVYRFFYGRWWMESFYLEPGDRVGREQELRDADPSAGPQAIDYGTNWYVLDIVADIDADRETVERGLGARVLLQRIDDPGATRWFDPRETVGDWEREQLQEAVELARLGGDLAGGPG